MRIVKPSWSPCTLRVAGRSAITAYASTRGQVAAVRHGGLAQSPGAQPVDGVARPVAARRPAPGRRTPRGRRAAPRARGSARRRRRPRRWPRGGPSAQRRVVGQRQVPRRRSPCAASVATSCGSSVATGPTAASEAGVVRRAAQLVVEPQRARQPALGRAPAKAVGERVALDDHTTSGRGRARLDRAGGLLRAAAAPPARRAGPTGRARPWPWPDEPAGVRVVREGGRRRTRGW